MNLLDKIISYVAPQHALKRQVSRNRLERTRALQNGYLARGFEAVSGDRFRMDATGTSQNVDSFLQSGGADALRQHVRYLEFQTGFVRGPIARMVNHVVGTGFQFQARVRQAEGFSISSASAERFNGAAERAFATWCKQADQRLLHRFWVQLRQIEGALIRDGEVLVVGRQSARTGRLVPYCQQVLEVDRLRTPPSEVNNPRVRSGFRLDDEGVPASCFVLRRHPGDSMTPALGLRADDYEEIPMWWPNGTRKVFFLCNPVRPEQLRGFSMFGPALKDMQDLDRYREAEIMAALEDACMTGFVKSDAAYAFQQGYTTESDSESNRIHEFAPNKWHYLSPGEDVTIHSPNRPNSAFGEFTEQLQAGPANALDIPPEVMSQNWHGLNYSNARTILLQLQMVCRIRQKYLIDYYASPTYECVLAELVANGIVRADRYYAHREEYGAHVFIPPGWPWIDPEKEANGIISELQAGTENLPRVWARKGEDWEEQLEIEARVLKRKKELEAEYGIEFPKPKESVASEPQGQGEEKQPAKVKPKRSLEVVA